MTTATSSDQFEQRLDHLTAAAKALYKVWIDPFSIEVDRDSKVYIAFVSYTWNTDRDKIVAQICEDFNLTYLITPLSGKLAITLSSK